MTAAPTGTETYSREIISALLKTESPFRFRLYTRQSPPPGLLPQAGNYDVRALAFPRLWTHLRLSQEMLLNPPDLLFVPAHVIPPIHPRRSMVTVHDLGYLHFPRAHRTVARLYLDLSTRWSARSAHIVIADSEATRDDLVRLYGVSPDKVRVVYPALPSDFDRSPSPTDEIQAIKHKYAIDGDYMLSVGTLHPRKNYGRLLQALTRLPARFQLVIAGKKGWLYAEIQEAIENLGLGPRVRLLDYVPAADLPPLYSGASLFVFPSLYEGFGFPVLEAQARGVPVVCSSTSSLPEVAADAAEYFDPLDVEAIAAALGRVLNDEARRQELNERGCANAARFSWQQSARQILNLASASL